jgi:hypothetical protein
MREVKNSYKILVGDIVALLNIDLGEIGCDDVGWICMAPGKDHWLTVVNTVKNMKMAVFWVVAPCSLVEIYRPFRGACCLHHQDDADGGRKHL